MLHHLRERVLELRRARLVGAGSLPRLVPVGASRRTHLAAGGVGVERWRENNYGMGEDGAMVRWRVKRWRERLIEEVKERGGCQGGRRRHLRRWTDCDKIGSSVVKVG